MSFSFAKKHGILKSMQRSLFLAVFSSFGPLGILELNPLDQIIIELCDVFIDLLSQGYNEKLVQNGLVETFPDSIGLWTLYLRLDMVDLYHVKIKLVFMVFPLSTLIIKFIELIKTISIVSYNFTGLV